jgi:cbb3-type cytochrome oxidase maturation protein
VEVIYLLVPLCIFLSAVAVGAFVWAVRSGQFDDLRMPPWRVLFDDDAPRPDPGRNPPVKGSRDASHPPR